MLADKPEDFLFRVWVARCSGGEDAYSILMLLREIMEETNKAFRVQMYATDLEVDVIVQARGASRATVPGLRGFFSVWQRTQWNILCSSSKAYRRGKWAMSVRGPEPRWLGDRIYRPQVGYLFNSCLRFVFSGYRPKLPENQRADGLCLHARRLHSNSVSAFLHAGASSVRDLLASRCVSSF